MVTGDNILTAVSVAKDCDMIKEDQSIIIVNFRYNKDDHPELYYTLEGHSTSATANLPMSPSCGFTVTNDCLKSPDDEIDKGAGDTNYKRMTISNSVSSMSTIETNTNSINSKDNKDIESGGDFFFQRKKIKQEYNPYNLAPELPSNRYRFAMDGKTWAVCKEHYPELLAKFVTRGTIFARMSPDQKQALITELQDIGYYVAMCGDGANDCGALKSAHTGISLSEAESSVASPFTSKTATIACVPTVIREGRTALVTSFGIFKYMAAYSLVQFTSVLILYSIDSNLTDWQYLYIDLFMISIFAFFFGKTESYDGPLVKETPLNSLISLSPVVSLILQFTVTAILQIGAWFYVQAQPWFVPFVYESESAISEFLGCHQNYTIFAVSSFQYIALAVVFSKGKPYRKTIFSNKGFLLSVLINTAFAAYLITIPNDFMIQLFHMVMPKVPDGDLFRLQMLGLGVFTFVAAFFIEIFVVEMFVEKKLRYYFHNIEKSEKKYLSIENYLRQNLKWPPLSLYNNQENNSPDESPAKGGDSGTSKSPDDGSKDNDDDDTSPMSYAEISIEPIEDDNAVYFDRNSSILASFFERERSRLNSTGPGKEKSEPNEKLLNGHDDVFTDYSEIKRRNQQLKHEYLEMQFNDTVKSNKSSTSGPVNGFHSNNNADDNNRKLQEDATTNIDNSVELK
jgi:cation-transporting ATPase 13A3/4/5